MGDEENKDILVIKSIEEKRVLSEKQKGELKFFIEIGNHDERAKELIRLMIDVDQKIDYCDHHYNVYDLCFATALFLSCKFGRIELVKYLIDFGANVNEVDTNDYSPLMIASEKGHVEVVRILINNHADVNFINENGCSALYSVFHDEYVEIFELLVSSGVDISLFGGKALIYASSKKNVYFVKRLIELNANVNYIDEHGYNALHIACENNRINIVKVLMNNGADETLKNSDGKIPIEVAKNAEIKEFLTNFNLT